MYEVHEIELRIQKILNDNGIGSGSFSGKIMDAMKSAFFLGVHYSPIFKDSEEKESANHEKSVIPEKMATKHVQLCAVCHNWKKSVS